MIPENVNKTTTKLRQKIMAHIHLASLLEGLQMPSFPTKVNSMPNDKISDLSELKVLAYDILNMAQMITSSVVGY